VSKRSGSYPRVRISGDGAGVVSHAGGVLLVETARRTGLEPALSPALAPWRTARFVHDPGKTLLDLALAVALGGDCAADIAVLRAEPALFGSVASDPTVSRLIDTLAAAGDTALTAIRAARAAARAHAWQLAGERSPARDDQITVDIDGVLLTAHSEKQDAAPTWKKGYGHHPLTAFLDHGAAGTGEPAAMLLRAGNAGSNTAADHITTARLALAQLPKRQRRGHKTLIRTDSAGGTQQFLTWLTRPGRALSYSVGMTITDQIHRAALSVPPAGWTPAYNAERQVREGAWIADITGMLELSGWPKGMRILIRKERAHPGAQLRVTDLDGHRLTAFATNTRRGQLADLELRHRRRARAEDRIRAARTTGLRNLPFHDTAQNQIWLEIVQLALDLLAWMPMLALDDPARRWEPKKLRFRLLSVCARLTTSARAVRLRFPRQWPWTELITAALNRLRALPHPG
jgi:hypothetical protein